MARNLNWHRRFLSERFADALGLDELPLIGAVSFALDVFANWLKPVVPPVPTTVNTGLSQIR